MNTDRLRSDLQVLSDRASTPPSGLADDVLRRRRTLRSRRLAVAGAALGVALVVGLVPVIGGGGAPDRSTARPAGADGEVRGSLAGDSAFVAGLLGVPWTYQQWRSPDGLAVTLDPQLRPAADWTSETTDLAAAYTAEQRDVVFVGDVPAGRWALIALHSAGGDTAAWFTGPVGARPDQMTISGTPQSVSDGEPLAHVDLVDARRTLVVVADPGDAVEVSDRAVLTADGSSERAFTPVADEDGDGVVVTTLQSSTRFGVAASVRVARGGEVVWRSAPSTAGRAAGIDQDDPRGWSVGIAARTGATIDPGYDYLDQALATALAPFGLDLDGLADGDAPELAVVFQGSPDGSAIPLITVYSVRLPSGARLLLGGWTDAPGDTTPDGLAPDQGVPYLDVRPAGVDPADDVVAVDMQAGRRTLVISGPLTAGTAVVRDGDGEELARVPLVDGMTSLAFPSGASTVQVLDQDGSPGQQQRISTGQIGTWGDYGRSATSFFATPFPPPA